MRSPAPSQSEQDPPSHHMSSWTEIASSLAAWQTCYGTATLATCGVTAAWRGR